MIRMWQAGSLGALTPVGRRPIRRADAPSVQMWDTCCVKFIPASKDDDRLITVVRWRSSAATLIHAAENAERGSRSYQEMFSDASRMVLMTLAAALWMLRSTKARS